MKNIWHLGAWSNNYGDRVLQAANTAILKEHSQEDTNFTYINCQQTYFSKSLIKHMNKSADLLYIGGGGLIFNRPEDNSHSGWQFNIDIDNLDLIEIPILVYGLGFNKFPYDNHVFGSNTWDSLKKLLKLSCGFSVRNSGTLRVLGENGLDTSNITVVPDAGLFAKATLFDHQIFDNQKLKIGLNWASDRPEQRFQNDWKSYYIRTLNHCQKIIQNYDAHIYLIEHLLENPSNMTVKREMRSLAKNLLGKDVSIIYKECYQELYPPFEYNSGLFVDIYKKMDIVFGMRGHANIIPFGQKTPFLALGEHNKVRWFADEVGMSKYVLDLKDEDDIICRISDLLDPNLKDLMEREIDRQTKIKGLYLTKVLGGIGWIW